MLRIMLIALTALYFTPCEGSYLEDPTINQIKIDEGGDTLLIGLSNRKGLMQAPFESWFTKNYDTYKVDKTTTRKMSNLLDKVTITAFMGTWCGDSKRLIPKFYKVLDALKFDEKNLTLVNLDHEGSMYKKSPNGEEKGKNIHRVPYLIIYKNGKVMGRIVEYPVTSIEVDLAQILMDVPSITSYPSVDYLHDLLASKSPDDINQDLSAVIRQLQDYDGSASELNTYGFIALKDGHIAKAELIFKLNTIRHPDAWYTWSNLAKVYFEKKDYLLATVMYNQVLSIDPENERATEMLQKIKDLTSDTKA